jgi:anti-anti-sigma regulatory factor
MDLNGMEALLHCMEGIAAHDGALQITGISPEAAILFELTGMDQLFAKFPGFAAEAPSFEFSRAAVPEEVQEITVEFPLAA